MSKFDLQTIQDFFAGCPMRKATEACICGEVFLECLQEEGITSVSRGVITRIEEKYPDFTKEFAIGFPNQEQLNKKFDEAMEILETVTEKRLEMEHSLFVNQAQRISAVIYFPVMQADAKSQDAKYESFKKLFRDCYFGEQPAVKVGCLNHLAKLFPTFWLRAQKESEEYAAAQLKPFLAEEQSCIKRLNRIQQEIDEAKKSSYIILQNNSAVQITSEPGYEDEKLTDFPIELLKKCAVRINDEKYTVKNGYRRALLSYLERNQVKVLSVTVLQQLQELGLDREHIKGLTFEGDEKLSQQIKSAKKRIKTLKENPCYCTIKGSDEPFIHHTDIYRYVLDREDDGVDWRYKAFKGFLRERYYYRTWVNNDPKRSQPFDAETIQILRTCFPGCWKRLKEEKKEVHEEYQNICQELAMLQDELKRLEELWEEKLNAKNVEQYIRLANGEKVLILNE